MSTSIDNTPALRRCLRAPIPEIFDAARYLDAAVSAHLSGRFDLAEELIRLSDIPIVREWIDSLWRAQSPYVVYRHMPDSPPLLSKVEQLETRMPSAEQKAALLKRDGHHCRFCGIPVIRAEVRVRIQKRYPKALYWGTRTSDQHPAFQALWLQYDHLIPHSRGGGNELDNLVITCAGCNYSRMHYTVEEVGLIDPRNRLPTSSGWDGLERFL